MTSRVEDLSTWALNPTWRFMGSYSGVRSPQILVWVIIVTLLITPLVTTPEPPSRPFQVPVPLSEQRCANLQCLCQSLAYVSMLV